MSISKEQIIKIHTILNNDGRLEEKPHLVSRFTSNGEMSTKALSFEQANELIKYLGGTPHKQKKPTDFSFGVLNRSIKQHSYIVSLLFQLGWTRKSNNRDLLIVDTERFGAWVKARTKLKEPIGKLNRSDTSVVITQLEQMLKKSF
ncbi:MAG: hypothetical protein ACPGSD_17395 [Flavobacteriales bacterium]